MKKMGAILAALCLTAVLCGCGNSGTASEDMAEITQAVETTEASAKMSSKEICESMQKTLHEYYSENILVEYLEANNVYQISYWADGATAMSLAAEEDEEARKDWDALVERMKNLSLASKQSLANYAPDARVAAVVVNEKDHSKILLAALDGEVIMDVVYGIGAETEE